MKVGYAILARFAETTPGGVFTIVGGNINRINAEEVPVILTHLSVVVRFDVSEADWHKTHKFVVNVYKDGVTVGDSVSETDISPKEGTTSHVQIANYASRIFREFGHYEIRLFLNGKQESSLTLMVAKP